MKVVKTIKNSAKFIMEKDADLLDSLKDEPILHFYQWESDSLTYGYFVDIAKYIDVQKAKVKNLSLAKRPTGGGIVFHIWDLAFSFLMPSNNEFFFLNPLENYKFVNKIVLNAIKEFLDDSFLLEKDQSNIKITNQNFCMAKPTKYDVIYNNKKIAGASQRRKKNGYLHQVSLCLISPDLDYIEDVVVNKDIASEIFLNSHPIFSSDDLAEKRKIIIKNLIKSFENQIS